MIVSLWPSFQFVIEDKVMKEYYEKYLKTIPAADVVEGVRCGECKLYGGRPWENGQTGICARTDIGVAHDDFCSYGLRKDDDSK